MRVFVYHFPNKVHLQSVHVGYERDAFFNIVGNTVDLNLAKSACIFLSEHRKTIIFAIIKNTAAHQITDLFSGNDFFQCFHINIQIKLVMF